jgi:hypothetical protein
MTVDIVVGLCVIAAGLRMIHRRRRVAADSAAHHESWMGGRGAGPDSTGWLNARC